MACIWRFQLHEDMGVGIGIIVIWEQETVCQVRAGRTLICGNLTYHSPFCAAASCLEWLQVVHEVAR